MTDELANLEKRLRKIERDTRAVRFFFEILLMVLCLAIGILLDQCL